MRVISGTLRGRRLSAPVGLATRPTTDRIRESLFNILAAGIRNRHVLDLFAGTGALGIEAMSRGAASAVFVDRARPALAAIRRNLLELGLTDQTRVINWDIGKNLNCLASAPQAFDLVFMDPPYETNCVMPALTALVSCGALAPDARVVIEHSAREPLRHPIGTLGLADQRRFGKTLVSFMEPML
ncbi:methyltransferase [Desulfosarcina alkanivorans]|uniref:Methyltransferase n=1 Tax=Desulfosarcina alkanivorans TaxID=571177 RepID=A0A5K7YKT9_9BACT|nr:16S rRNA (guanine(966)-N(2))-methyltransferase RsmD [Desulfosarcina alkanivorans]BBO69143.1 methyltransferase [Desulfosarcina alkanivorans]